MPNEQVIQADRDAAAEYTSLDFPDEINALAQIFARHRAAFAANGGSGGEDGPAFFKLYNALHEKISKATDDERRSVSISTKQLGEILDWAGTYQRMAHPSEQERETMAIIKRGADLIKPGAGETVFYLRVGGERSQLSTHAAPGVDPQMMLGLAIDALRAEAGDAAKCPVHKTSPAPAGREDEEEAAYQLGLAEGRDHAMQEIDLATGGDGEYRYCTVPDERHCPDADAMRTRIVERFTAPAGREAIARIVEPEAWKRRDRYAEILRGEGRLPADGDALATMQRGAANQIETVVASSLAKADAILALAPSQGEGESATYREALRQIRARTYSANRDCALRAEPVAEICDIATSALTPPTGAAI